MYFNIGRGAVHSQCTTKYVIITECSTLLTFGLLTASVTSFGHSYKLARHMLYNQKRASMLGRYVITLYALPNIPTLSDSD